MTQVGKFPGQDHEFVLTGFDMSKKERAISLHWLVSAEFCTESSLRTAGLAQGAIGKKRWENYFILIIRVLVKLRAQETCEFMYSTATVMNWNREGGCRFLD